MVTAADYAIFTGAYGSFERLPDRLGTMPLTDMTDGIGGAQRALSTDATHLSERCARAIASKMRRFEFLKRPWFAAILGWRWASINCLCSFRPYVLGIHYAPDPL